MTGAAGVFWLSSTAASCVLSSWTVLSSVWSLSLSCCTSAVCAHPIAAVTHNERTNRSVDRCLADKYTDATPLQLRWSAVCSGFKFCYSVGSGTLACSARFYRILFKYVGNGFVDRSLELIHVAIAIGRKSGPCRRLRR